MDKLLISTGQIESAIRISKKSFDAGWIIENHRNVGNRPISKKGLFFSKMAGARGEISKERSRSRKERRPKTQCLRAFWRAWQELNLRPTA